jgi:iron complex transport system substrate-binding protein
MKRFASRRKKNRSIWLPILISVVLLAALLLAAGCQVEKTAQKDKGGGEKESQTTYPMTIKDDSGKSVKIKKQPKTVVSMSPACTEILFAIGLDKEIIGVTSYCDYPADAKKKEKIGSFAQPNIEKIVALKPDLVLSTGNLQDEQIKELRRLGTTVLAVYPKNIDGVTKDIALIGKIMGHEKEAESVVEKMAGVRDRVKKSVAKLKKNQRPKVFFELYNEPLTTAGADTFQDELVTLAGGENISGNLKEQYPQYSLDELIKQNPEVYLAGSGTMSNPGSIEKRAGFADIDAVKNGRVTVINDDLVNRPGPRITVGLWEIAKAIHPELFK